MMFPWVKIPLHARTTREDFLDWLRYRAIDWGMPTLFIDCVDDLRADGDKQDEIDTLKEELDLMEEERDDLRSLLRELLAAEAQGADLSEIDDLLGRVREALP